MALKTVALPRTFYSSGRKLADPNPALSIEEVRAHYAGIYPELNNSSFEEEITGTEHKITFSTLTDTVWATYCLEWVSNSQSDTLGATALVPLAC
jgi:PRTRC genetic system protein C